MCVVVLFSYLRLFYALNELTIDLNMVIKQQMLIAIG